jgi:hypothetical protein
MIFELARPGFAFISTATIHKFATAEKLGALITLRHNGKFARLQAPWFPARS